jgi:hypothetical protein
MLTAELEEKSARVDHEERACRMAESSVEVKCRLFMMRLKRKISMNTPAI